MTIREGNGKVAQCYRHMQGSAVTHRDGSAQVLILPKATADTMLEMMVRAMKASSATGRPNILKKKKGLLRRGTCSGS